MYFSKHNIISRIKNSNEFFIINPLTQQADILSNEEAQKILQKNYSLPALTEKKYVLTKEEELKIYKEKYLNFIDTRDSDEIQIFFVPWYACNFACSYCFQDEYTNPNERVSTEVIDSFFSYINSTFAGRKKYITIFGGEPFLQNQINKDSISYIISKANEYNLDIAVVTNGYFVEEYIEILKTGKIREIQITLDGMQEVHDSRRILKGGLPSFEKISKGIDTLLENNIPVNLRMVIDKNNIQEIPKLAKYAIEKGWTKSPLFKTQLGRNYELHHCQTNNQRLYTRLEMYEDLYALIQSNPEILEFHKPAFSISKFLWEQGELPEPLFDSCTGTKTEWAFDYTGSIYSCTATVGKTEERLGTFYPNITLDVETIELWQDRDVISIQKCNNCNVQLACGGGCAAVAKNQYGSILSEDCRPIKELLELGISLYFKDEII
jgi:uncharacterized protein